jgi:hypothetical protein
MDAYAFNLFAIDDPDLEAYLVGQINAGGVIRVIVCPEAGDMGAELVSSGNYGSTSAAFVPRLTVVAGN